MALARGARLEGAKIVENTPVTKVIVENGRAVGVETREGAVRAETVVNCTGIWARTLGLAAGVDIPLQACEHFYIVTDPMEGMHPDLPIMRDMDHCAYYKEDAGKLLLGAFEPVAKPWALDGIPEDFAFASCRRISSISRRFSTTRCAHAEPARRRHPQVLQRSRKLLRRWPLHLGPRPRWNATSSVPASTRSASSRAAAPAWRSRTGSSTASRRSTCGRRHRRFFPHQNAKSFLVPRVSESLGLLYAMHWPFPPIRELARHSQVAAA
jgi:4-methylaminobutanoate oxidase (formaldehyde-forming)